MEKFNYSITPAIRNFIIRNTKLELTPKNGIVGYNHVMRIGASKRAITSDIAYYLLINDLNIICQKINEHIKVELNETQLCALVSYFHSNNILPDHMFFVELNSNTYKLFGEQLFYNTIEKCILKSGEAVALRKLQYDLWNNDVDFYLKSKVTIL